MNKKDKELDEFFAGFKEPTDTSEQPLAPLIAMPGPNEYVPAQRTQPHLLVPGAAKGYSMQDGYSTYDLTSGGTHHPLGANPSMTAVATAPTSTGSAVSQVVEIPSFNPATVIAQDTAPEVDIGKLHMIRGPIQTGTGGVVMDSAGRPITSPNATDSYYTLLDQNGAYVQPQRAQQGAPGKGAGGK